jgi:hypothetical protein
VEILGDAELGDQLLGLRALARAGGPNRIRFMSPSSSVRESLDVRVGRPLFKETAPPSPPRWMVVVRTAMRVAARMRGPRGPVKPS